MAVVDKVSLAVVSETEGDETSIKGEFADCHDMRRFVETTTHLNMFSNDYFG